MSEQRDASEERAASGSAATKGVYSQAALLGSFASSPLPARQHGVGVQRTGKSGEAPLPGHDARGSGATHQRRLRQQSSPWALERYLAVVALNRRVNLG